MTDEERQQLKARLVEAGFWDADESGDPTTESRDTLILVRQIWKMIKGELRIKTNTDPLLSRYLMTWTVSILCAGTSTQLATGNTYSEAVCVATLALPEFLRQHPECAASVA